MPQIDPKYRVVAGVLALAGAVVLVLQTGIVIQRRGVGLFAALWSLAGTFTILTNLAMALTFATIACTGRRLSFGWMSGLTLSMVMVGGVYHTLLAHLVDFSGLRWWTDHGLHTLLPVAMLWFWLSEVTRHDPRTGRPLMWLVWPALYALYALVRGVATGRYPYPFLNPDRIGWAMVGVNMAGLLVVFAALAFALHALGTRMPLRDHNSAR